LFIGNFTMFLIDRYLCEHRKENGFSFLLHINEVGELCGGVFW